MVGYHVHQLLIDHAYPVDAVPDELSSWKLYTSTPNQTVLWNEKTAIGMGIDGGVHPCGYVHWNDKQGWFMLMQHRVLPR